MERKPENDTTKPEPARGKWWRRYGDGDWRWSEESWQTDEQATAKHPQKESKPHETDTRN